MNIFYHWWHTAGDPPPCANLRSPLILSIATTRAHCPDAKIHVLDGSAVEVDWSGFDNKLDFQVHRVEHSLKQRYSHRLGFEHLSRLFDLDNFTKEMTDLIVYQDVDVFRLKPPSTNHNDRFAYNGNNSGYFYYNPASKIVQRFYEIFRAYTLTALNDEMFRVLHRQYVNYNQWYYIADETMLTYIQNKHPDLIHPMQPGEHVRGGSVQNVLPSDWQMIHFNGIMVRNPITKWAAQREHSRGLACLLIKELYDSVTQVLTESDLRLIFTEDELNGYLPMQRSLEDEAFMARLLATRSAAGHLHLFDAC